MFALVLFFLPVSSVVLAEKGGEAITKYDVHISVQADGSFEAVEEILYDFGSNERHGIFRNIPRTYESASEGGNETYKLLIENVAVSSQTAPDVFRAENTKDAYRFQIGDPERTITGEHRYLLTYDVLNAISFFEEFDEVYWNATGNEWDVPINEATLRIELPQKVNSSELIAFCYEGPFNSKEICENTVFLDEIVEDTAGVLFTSRNLSAGEGLTGALGFPKGVVPEIERERAGPSKILIEFLAIVLSGLLVLTLVHALRSRKKHSEPKGRGTIVREYDAPSGLSPSEVGYIVDKQINNHDITAEIVYLAEQGYLHILSLPEKGFFKTNTAFYLLLTEEADNTLETYQRHIITSLFSDVYTLSKNEKDTFRDRVLKSKLIFHNKEMLASRIENAQSITPLKDLKNSFHVDLENIRKSLLSTMLEKQYLVKVPVLPLTLFVVFVIAIFAVSIALALLVAELVNPFFIAMMFISELLFVIFSSTAFPLYRRTESGVRAREHSLGLKEYLSIAEKDRLEFHFNPKNNPHLFEALLPFAIALRVDHQWAKGLEDIFVEPDWYTDARHSRLSVGNLHSSFRSFNAAAASSYAPPSSSGSTGGGFSGGGSGGGGGGSW